MSAVASRAASIADIRFSSTKRKMFSSTTMASSITTPTISTSASIVTLFSVKSSARIMAKVETTDAGMATAAIRVERHERMKSSTTSEARMLPRSEEHTSELQSRQYLVCRLLLEKKKNK